MHAHGRLGLLARGPERVPVPGVDGREPCLLGCFREAQRLEAAQRVSAHHLGGDLRVVKPRELTRDDASRIFSRPRLDMPVVPRPYARQRQFAIGGDGLHSDTGKTRQERREVERSVDPVQIHVLKASSDIPAAAAHFIEPGWLVTHLFKWPACHALKPIFGSSIPSYSHVSTPSARVITRGPRSASLAGSRPSNASGGST